MTNCQMTFNGSTQWHCSTHNRLGDSHGCTQGMRERIRELEEQNDKLYQQRRVLETELKKVVCERDKAAEVERGEILELLNLPKMTCNLTPESTKLDIEYYKGWNESLRHVIETIHREREEAE
jgi:hypothetical protein